MDHKDLCEHTKIRLIAAAIGHQQCTKTAANLVPIPGGERVIAIGTPAEVARLLARDTTTAAQPLDLDSLTRYEATDPNRHYADFPPGPMSVAAYGKYVLFEDVAALIAQAPVQQADSRAPVAVDERITKLRDALRHISETRFGWDGDCGVTSIADQALYADDEAAAHQAAPAQPSAARPTDDDLWDKTLRDRDTYHDWADKLAEAIAKHFGAEIGEHSNMNCPWAEALEVIEGAAPTSDQQAGAVALAEAIQRAAVKRGIIQPGTALIGPQLVMLCDDLAAPAAIEQAGAQPVVQADQDALDAKRYRILRQNVKPADINLAMTRKPPAGLSSAERIDFLCDLYFERRASLAATPVTDQPKQEGQQ